MQYMDLTQVVLGCALLAVGAVTFATPSMVNSTRFLSALALATVALAGGALLVGTVRQASA